ncbi:MAG: rhodanese-like domain-containing protein [Deltaproteobacteria bacterium]|nr:rhodanese-like domain-containing protein [Deltaproteobacteria bacterium]MBW2020195.1 rhodanese-like domain-containing protein [Deltaproteobacteria bacterium]MBW2075095.1 rhodanese-like domain-containing protein [Deltaproteobacteria bacterium]RLB81520.1 MAG: hypothetical protein DRH17_08940 [Deltaproteobacteria bacterium]
MRRKTSLYLGLLVLVTSFVLTQGVWAEDLRIISVQDLKAKMDAGEKLMLLNPLSDIEFNEGHIPGSVNIPLHEIMTTDKLPQDKDTLVITYCLGPK